MNLSHPDQNMHSAGEGCLEDDKPDAMMPCFRRNVYDEPLSSYSNGSIISQLLRKTIHSKRTLDESHFYLSSSTAADSNHEDQSSVSSKDSTVEAASPSTHVSTVPTLEGDHPVTDHLQAKRARVENIIRVMAGSPNSRHHGEPEKPETPDTKDTREAREAYRENKRKQRLPQHQEHSVGGPVSRRSSNSEKCTAKDEECHKLKEQLHSMQRLLRQLQEKFLQVYKQDDAEHNDRDETEVAVELDVLGDKVASHFVGSDDDFDRRSGRRAAECKDQMKVAGYLLHQRESQNLQEALKQELARAVNDCVDRVFKKASTAGLDLSPQQRMCSSPEMHLGMGGDRKSQQGSSAQEHPQAEEAAGRPHSLEYYESSEAQSPQDQTEALSLVVRKPAVTPLSSVTPTVKRPYPVHQTPFQFNYSTPLHDNQILEHLLKYGPHTNFGGLPCMPPTLDRTSPDTVELPWESIAMRSKVTSSHLGHHARPSALGAVTVDSLCLPHVKIECGELQSMAERNPYMSLNISFPFKKSTLSLRILLMPD